MPILHEYETLPVELTRAQAEALFATGVVDVRPSSDGRWLVTAGAHVGTLVVDGVELLIRPKIRPENLFLLLEPGLPDIAWRDEAFDYDHSSDLLPAVIGVFARAVETTLGRGLFRSYQHRQDSLVAMRGRLDMAEQFTRAGLMTPVACAFDEFTENVPENRALRAAIRAGLRVPLISPETRRRLMQHLVALDGVPDVVVRPDEIQRIHLTRLNEHYGPALRLAELILSNLSLVDSRGRTRASTFVVNMNDLFQRFVTERLGRELRGQLVVEREPAVHLGEHGQVRMNPDLVFRTPGGRRCNVGDVKYKIALGARGRSDDYYQLLAYTTSLDLPAGMLIYCRRRDDAVQKPVTVRNADKVLHVRAIDLSGTPEDVEREISGLARFVEETASRSSAY